MNTKRNIISRIAVLVLVTSLAVSAVALAGQAREIDRPINQGATQPERIEDVATSSEGDGEPDTSCGSKPEAECFDDWTLSGLWHVSDCRGQKVDWSLAYNKGNSCPDTYDTGTANSGNADSPASTAPEGTTSVIISFWSFVDTECGSNPCGYDVAELYYSRDGGASFEFVEGYGTHGWTHREHTVAASEGDEIVVRFHFDTIDNFFNAYEGWYVQEVDLDWDDSPPPPPATSVGSGTATFPGCPPDSDIVAIEGASSDGITWSFTYNVNSACDGYMNQGGPFSDAWNKDIGGCVGPICLTSPTVIVPGVLYSYDYTNSAEFHSGTVTLAFV